MSNRVKLSVLVGLELVFVALANPCQSDSMEDVKETITVIYFALLALSYRFMQALVEVNQAVIGLDVFSEQLNLLLC